MRVRIVVGVGGAEGDRHRTARQEGAGRDRSLAAGDDAIGILTRSSRPSAPGGTPPSPYSTSALAPAALAASARSLIERAVARQQHGLAPDDARAVDGEVALVRALGDVGRIAQRVQLRRTEREHERHL